METVEVVIKIPKQDFDFIIDEFAEGDMPDKKDLKETTYYAIANGTVLPKGHGRLIDADAINIHDVSPAYGMEVYGVTQDDIEYEPTIIEADTRRKHDRR